MAASGAVVVTGASTGIGEATALHLKSLGFEAFAGVRKDEDAERMRERGAIPLKLDVTDEGSIRAAREQVEEAVGGRGLAGLVNNAGVAVSGPIEFLPMEELRRQLDINVVGQAAVTQAFIPLLRQARGRIVNISSIGGRVALPLLGPYAASKFALEALSDSLRRELRPWGIGVVVVEPGGVRTPIWEKGGQAADDLMADAPPEADELYGELIRRIRSEADKLAREGLPPTAIAEVVAEALTSKRPKTRYLVGTDAKVRARLAGALPDKAFDALMARALSHG
jgi:NAD(P)-dependent dehydrogenase (short-subunit alcohol dehydrogenase family)